MDIRVPAGKKKEKKKNSEDSENPAEEEPAEKKPAEEGKLIEKERELEETKKA